MLIDATRSSQVLPDELSLRSLVGLIVTGDDVSLTCVHRAGPSHAARARHRGTQQGLRAVPLAVTAIVLVAVVVVLVANPAAGLSTGTEQPLVDEDASGLRADAGRRLHVEPELHRVP
ncbi:hypothetical protein [Demequina capsici]|uniref:Uncharacterized protein n=1 Tax=Demequina capsici TaxID=3075620 RepID=A0AA96J8J2_9MICO|nr:hypothetical protein [Demequina sp. OYTSA14]WNM25093.1 hypothetical protein RN606_02810 [Demequina sp. OYTSA14]